MKLVELFSLFNYARIDNFFGVFLEEYTFVIRIQMCCFLLVAALQHRFRIKLNVEVVGRNNHRLTV